MKLVKVNQSFYDLISKNNVEREIMFNEQGNSFLPYRPIEIQGLDVIMESII